MPFLANAAEALEDAAGHAVATSGGRWIDTGVTKLRTEVAPRLPSDGATVALAVADKIAANAPLLAGFAHNSVVEMAGYLSLGADDEARVVYLRDQATFDEAQSALVGATDAALQQSADRQAEWQEVKTFLLDLLVTAGKAAIPLLLSMI